MELVARVINPPRHVSKLKIVSPKGKKDIENTLTLLTSVASPKCPHLPFLNVNSTSSILFPPLCLSLSSLIARISAGISTLSNVAS